MDAHSNRGKKGASMNRQDLAMCPTCGYLWHLNADDQYRFVLFGETIVTCPKCYKHVSAVTPIDKSRQEHSIGIHATKV